MNNARKFWVLVATAAGPLLSAGAAEPAPAATPQLRIAPLTLDVSLAPGESITRDVTVSAGSAAPLTVAFEHADFGFSPGNYAVQLIEDSAPTTVEFSTREWFSVMPTTFKIPAGKSLTIPLTITAPGNVGPGTHLGAALFRTVPGPRPPGGTQIVTSARTGPLVFVTIRGGSRPKPRIGKLKVPALVTTGPIPVTLSAAVSGDGYVRVSGTVELSGNNMHDKIEVPEKIVVAGSSRTLIPGAQVGHKLGGKSLKVGRYTVTSTLIIAPTGRKLTRVEHVWLIPVWLIVATGTALLLILVSVGVGIRMFVHNRRGLAVALAEVDEDLAGKARADDAFDEHDADEESSVHDEGDIDDDSSLDDEHVTADPSVPDER
ncbi:MAG: hypothetical protein H7123_04675 [Thermoleophilia bacterium]|nr:hypothetical protein [Thermoleophilia bacterium]